jgi:hypothetical protein
LDSGTNEKLCEAKAVASIRGHSMIPFAKLTPGDIFESRTGRWRKIFPTANTDRRCLPPWNAIRLDPPTIHPNLWKLAERLKNSEKEKDQREGNTLAIELNTLAASPVYGTFLDGFLVTKVDERAPALIDTPAAAVVV